MRGPFSWPSNLLTCPAVNVRRKKNIRSCSVTRRTTKTPSCRCQSRFSRLRMVRDASWHSTCSPDQKPLGSLNSRCAKHKKVPMFIPVNLSAGINLVFKCHEKYLPPFPPTLIPGLQLKDNTKMPLWVQKFDSLIGFRQRERCNRFRRIDEKISSLLVRECNSISKKTFCIADEFYR